MDSVKCRAVLDPVGVSLNKRVFDCIFLRSHFRAQIYRWAVVVRLGTPQVCARFTRSQFNVIHDSVARLAFIALDKHGSVLKPTYANVSDSPEPT